jgi:hypothetical protein
MKPSRRSAGALALKHDSMLAYLKRGDSYRGAEN